MTPCPEPLLWLVDADTMDKATLARYAGWLGESERARCTRFVRAGRRRQFIVGRALLRLALARLLEREPATIALLERPGQAPMFEFPSGMNGGYSISHSGQWVACAASLHTRLGLDIECLDLGRDVIALAQQAFSPAQAAIVQACTPEARHGVFYRMWCAHEARIKLGPGNAHEYALVAPGLAGVLASAAPLAAQPRLLCV